MTKVVIVNKKRFMLSMIFIMVILFFTISSMLALINRVEGYQEPEYIEVVVQSGDTVWDIARELSPKHKDVRRSIYEIGIINDLRSYDIFPGQVIRIPME
ncbi:MAG: LysM peptidoglycan-binding domain-containing protein [Maledivibacter sp.]|jgi:cell division protein YceG involved in septum cleavage|nr:LysM peptidoglycan-binding domain-containing protein [Maledivibacter sp.]